MKRANREWVANVRAVLDSFGMPLDVWQKAWSFDFDSEYRSGASAPAAANKANRFWWREHNRSLNEECRASRDCWLPYDHQGRCETIAGEQITMNRKTGIVEKIECSDDSFGQQYTTIDGKTYWAWFGLNDGVRIGVNVEFTEKLNHRVGPRSNPVRADVAEDIRAIGPA